MCVKIKISKVLCVKYMRKASHSAQWLCVSQTPCPALGATKQSRYTAMDRDQRQVIKIIKENATCGSTLKTLGVCRLELKKAENVYAKSCHL